MGRIQDWRGREIETARSMGGVVAVADPWDNLVRGDVHPWPPPELIQKVHQSRQARAFVDRERLVATATLGFYSDLQSIRSEDSVTWSFFGPVVYADARTRARFIQDLLEVAGVSGTAANAHVWLWRRLPHPDTFVSGGPEVDFGIHTDDVFLLGEAKWRSPAGSAQGVDRSKDQLTLRREFCQKYGRRLLPDVHHFVVLAVSWKGGLMLHGDTEEDGVQLHLRDTTWGALAGIRSHPCALEFGEYLKWKVKHSVSG